MPGQVSRESLRSYRLTASCEKKEKAWDSKAQIKTQSKILPDTAGRRRGSRSAEILGVLHDQTHFDLISAKDILLVIF